jgi:hypothetical protein
MAEVSPRDVLLRVGGRTLARYGTLTQRLAPEARGGEEGKETFTRASVKRYRDRSGIGRKAAADVPALEWVDLDGDGVLDTPGILLEGARGQRVANPENFSLWSVTGTPILTSGQSDPFGGTSAYLIEDNDGASNETVFSAPPFVGDATKTVSLFLKQGTAAQSAMNLRDDTAGSIIRHQVLVVWTAGVPALQTVSGAGKLFTPEKWANGWYRCAFSADGVIAANTNNLYLYPAGPTGSATGTTYFFGVNAWDALFPSSYQGPGETPSVADALTLSFGFGPMDLTALARVYRPHHADVTGALTWAPYICRLGSSVPHVVVRFASSARLLGGGLDTSGTDATSFPALPAGLDLADCLQVRALTTGGYARVDVGSGFQTEAGPATAFSAFGTQTLRVGASGTAGEELYGVLIDLLFLRRLFTRAEALLVP